MSTLSTMFQSLGHAGGDVLDIEQARELAPPPQSLAESFREVVLLGGFVRAGRMDHRIDRSLLQLPVDSTRYLIDHWVEQVAELARWFSRDSITLRIVVNKSSDLQFKSVDTSPVRVVVEQDADDYRGTGGVVRDVVTKEFQPDDRLLIANGAQVIVGSLTQHLAELTKRGGDVLLVGHREGTPSGLMLLRAGVVERIPNAGFIDMKEQALPRIASHHDVRVIKKPTPTSLPVRTVADYITALRAYHQQRTSRAVNHDPFAEHLHSSFSIVEPGAEVGSNVLLHDSVVLSGARVSSGAAVVRSVIGPNATVKRGQRVVDRLLSKDGPDRSKSR